MGWDITYQHHTFKGRLFVCQVENAMADFLRSFPFADDDVSRKAVCFHGISIAIHRLADAVVGLAVNNYGESGCVFFCRRFDSRCRDCCALSQQEQPGKAVRFFMNFESP